MSGYTKTSVYKSSYDLLLFIFRLSDGFSKAYKYTVGEQLKQEAMSLLTLIHRANSVPDKAEELQKAREHVERVRLYIRVMNDLHQITLNQFVQTNVLIEDISKQLTAWQKYNKNVGRSRLCQDAAE